MTLPYPWKSAEIRVGKLENVMAAIDMQSVIARDHRIVLLCLFTVTALACLRHCQTPLGFLLTRWHDG